MDAVNVFVRKEDGDEEEYDDIWDDELLIKAYNKSVDEIKEKIAHRMGLFNGVPENCKQKDKREANAKMDVPKKAQNNKMKWKVGDFCRAVYSDDGLEYEAQITNLSSDGQCVVKYCGYGNEESIKIKNLKKSLGENSRAAQQLEATGGQDFPEDCNENSKFFQPSIPGLPAVPPPPAFSLTSQFNQETESEALSAMLMSWYMSGYHTGYYQGLMQAKKQTQNSTHSK